MHSYTMELKPLTKTESGHYNEGTNILPELLNGQPEPETLVDMIRWLVSLGYGEPKETFLNWGTVLQNDEDGSLIAISGYVADTIYINQVGEKELARGKTWNEAIESLDKAIGLTDNCKDNYEEEGFNTWQDMFRHFEENIKRDTENLVFGDVYYTYTPKIYYNLD